LKKGETHALTGGQAKASEKSEKIQEEEKVAPEETKTTKPKTSNETTGQGKKGLHKVNQIHEGEFAFMTSSSDEEGKRLKVQLLTMEATDYLP